MEEIVFLRAVAVPFITVGLPFLLRIFRLGQPDPQEAGASLPTGLRWKRVWTDLRTGRERPYPQYFPAILHAFLCSLHCRHQHQQEKTSDQSRHIITTITTPTRHPFHISFTRMHIPHLHVEVRRESPSSVGSEQLGIECFEGGHELATGLIMPSLGPLGRPPLLVPLGDLA